MGQVSMTVRMDAQQKLKFDSLCSQFGMSANTAMNIFVNAVVRLRSIPFEIKAMEDSTCDEGRKAFSTLRAEAQRNGLTDMTQKEINEEIQLARKERDKDRF